MLTKLNRTKNIDFTDLENEVMDLWDDQGIEYTRTENVGFTPPDPAFYETSILPEFETLLSNPLWCVNQLGFDSLASYIASKRKEEQTIGSPVTYEPSIFNRGIIGKPIKCMPNAAGIETITITGVK